MKIKIKNDMKVGVVTSTNKLDKINNIIKNFKQQLYLNKKLFLVINNNQINIELIKNELKNENINYEIILVDEKYNLGYCLNIAIEKMKEQNYEIFSKFDDDDIYDKKYLLEQIYYLYTIKCDIVGKYNIPLFIPEYNSFYEIENFNKNNQFTEICLGSTITFNINNINKRFDINKKVGVDIILLKELVKEGKKIYVTSFNNYIWIRNLDNSKHNSNFNENNLKLIKINDSKLVYDLYYNLINYKLIDVSHLLVTVIITMYNSSKTIEKCILSIINQTHKNIEIIVVDDCSKDNSIILIEQIMSKYNNIKLIKNKENFGTYYCKNIALKQMSLNTKYIAFQDSDDYSHYERIRKQIEILYLTNGKLSITLCERYDKLRIACISQVYDIEIFNKLGYFDNSRFGADSIKLSSILNYYEKKDINSDFSYKNIYQFFSNLKNCFIIPQLLYIINNNDNTLTSNNKLNSNTRKIYNILSKKHLSNIKISLNSSFINYIPINYNDEYIINYINNKISLNKDQFKILNNILIIFDLYDFNQNINIFIKIYEMDIIFENKLKIYKENNLCYSYIFIDNPKKVLSFDIIIDNYENIEKIRLKNIDYTYYFNNITKKLFFYNYPYKEDNQILTNLYNFEFLNINYNNKEKLNNDSKYFKNINTKIIKLPFLDLNITNIQPLVSIIITCYNCQDTIKLAIESLLNQTYKNIEIIIVDDYSNDNSVNIINTFKDFNNIKIILNNANMKTYYSRNIALENCSGDFITFHDADDISLYNRIEKQVNYAIKNKSHINIGLCVRSSLKFNNINLKESNNSLFDKIINNINFKKLNNKKSFNLPFKNKPHLALVTSFIHKSVFKDIGNFNNLPCSGDIEYIERFIFKKYNIIFIDGKFGNLSTLLSSICNFGSIYIMKEIIYIAKDSDNNLTSKYDKDFRNNLKKIYRNKYKKENKNVKYIELCDDLLHS